MSQQPVATFGVNRVVALIFLIITIIVAILFFVHTLSFEQGAILLLADIAAFMECEALL